MRYPNRRYGNPTAMQYYAIRYGDIKHLARFLRRSERSVTDWLSGAARVPWWVPEIMRLQQMESDNIVYQMTGRQVSARLGLAAPAGDLIDAGARFRPDEPLPIVTPAAAPVLAANRRTG